jgi:hypothetical protein
MMTYHCCLDSPLEAVLRDFNNVLDSKIFGCYDINDEIHGVSVMGITSMFRHVLLISALVWEETFSSTRSISSEVALYPVCSRSLASWSVNLSSRALIVGFIPASIS